MKMKNDIIINSLKKICAECPTVKRAMLFGSRARGDNKERSDYDVAIFGNVSKNDKLKIALCIDDVPTLLKIDVVFADELDEDKFKENILKDGIIFYDRT